MKRRTFFKFGLTSAALTLLKSKNLYGRSIQEEKPLNTLIKRNNIVVSTWSHGIKANEEAWRGGRVLWGGKPYGQDVLEWEWSLR